MRLDAVELRRVAMPLVRPFTTSFGTQTARDVLLVRVHGRVRGPDGAVETAGWGECVAGDEPTYSSEYVEGAQHVLQAHLLPRLLAAQDATGAPVPLDRSDGDGVPARRVAAVLAPVHGHRMAKAAVEMAVLDAELRARGEPLAARLGAVRDAVPAGVSVGIAGDVDALLDEVAGYLEQGYVRIKLKIEPGWDVEPIAAVRDRFGDVPLQVDANAAYTLADARHLRRLDSFDLLLLEQPLAEDDLRGHAELARGLRTPVCLDESVTSARSAVDALLLGACQVVNVKAGRVGGYLEAVRVADVCAAHGVPVWCGGMVETGLGRAANAALAALPNFRLPGDVSAASRFYARDLVTRPAVLEDGHVRVPTGPGLGVDVDDAVLAEITTATATVRAGR